MAHYGYLIKTGDYPPYQLSKRIYKSAKNAEAAAMKFAEKHFPNCKRIMHIRFGEEGELPLLDYYFEQNKIHYEEKVAEQRSRHLINPWYYQIKDEKGFLATLHEDKNSLIAVIAIAAFAIISLSMIFGHLYRNGILDQF